MLGDEPRSPGPLVGWARPSAGVLFVDARSRSWLRPSPHPGGEESEVLQAFLLSFGMIFVAELGDKSQLMAMAFAARYNVIAILIGIAIATAIVHPSRCSSAPRSATASRRRPSH